MGTFVVERKYFTCRSRQSNPGRWIYRQTLYRVAVKAGFYRKAVEVYLYIPRPCDTRLQLLFAYRKNILTDKRNATVNLCRVHVLHVAAQAYHDRNLESSIGVILICRLCLPGMLANIHVQYIF